MITIDRNEYCVGEIARREAFKNKGFTMHGEWLRFDQIEQCVSELNNENWEALASFFAESAGTRCFVVFSYNTPIVAVNADGEAWQTTQKFSSTTTRHHNLFKRGL